jgi:hypothetical protein
MPRKSTNQRPTAGTRAAAKKPRVRSRWVRLRSPTIKTYRVAIKLDSFIAHGMPRGPDGKRLVASRPEVLNELIRATAAR